MDAVSEFDDKLNALLSDPGKMAQIMQMAQSISGGEDSTTNNRMELTAVIEGLAALKEPCEVTLTSDSKYVLDALLKGWVYSWKKNGWKKADKKPALNVDLWERLLALLEVHKVDLHWVHGHQGHPENERCDALAVAAYQRYLTKNG